MGFAGLNPSYDSMVPEMRPVGWVEAFCAETHRIGIDGYRRVYLERHGGLMGCASLNPSYNAWIHEFRLSQPPSHRRIG